MTSKLRQNAKIAGRDVCSYRVVTIKSSNIAKLEQVTKSKFLNEKGNAITPLPLYGETFAWGNIIPDGKGKKEMAKHEGVSSMRESPKRVPSKSTNISSKPLPLIVPQEALQVFLSQAHRNSYTPLPTPRHQIHKRLHRHKARPSNSNWRAQPQPKVPLISGYLCP